MARTDPPLDQVLEALADQTRRDVIGLLLEGPRRPGEIAARLGVSSPALSRHLRVLRRAKLVVERPVDDDRRARLCTVNPPGLVAVRQWLDQVEHLWTVQLGGFKEYGGGCGGGTR